MIVEYDAPEDNWYKQGPVFTSVYVEDELEYNPPLILGPDGSWIAREQEYQDFIGFVRLK